MKWFDNIYVINLKSREDRLKRAQDEFKRIGFEFTRIEAVDGVAEDIEWVNNTIPRWNQNAAGLVESTIKVLEDAIAKDYETILICEDDIEFIYDFKSFLNTYNMPNKGEWDMFFFGVINQWPPEYYNQDAIKLTRAFCCHCYAINKRVFEHYLNFLRTKDTPIDRITADFFMPHGRCLSTKYPIAFQTPDYSNIENKHVHNKVN